MARIGKPLKSVNDLNTAIRWKDYHFANHFTRACDVVPDIQNEEIEISNIYNNVDLDTPCVYASVINGKLFRLGASENGLNGRISSYNSGKNAYRKSGSNSVTNWWVLQSKLNMKQKIIFYAHLLPRYTAKYFGNNKEKKPWPSTKDFKSWLITDFEDVYGTKPIGVHRK